jgi:hypothetical protein
VETRRCIAGLLSATLLACAATQTLAQTGSSGLPDALTPLRHGPLIVWFVEARAHAPNSNLAAIADLHHATPLTYQEQTAGSFGQSANTFGENSGSYGVDSTSSSISTPKSAPGEDAPSAGPNGIGYRQQDSGSFGQSAGSYGSGESSNYGTASSDLGQTSGSFGTSASNYGQNAGGFGNSTNTIADAGNPTAKPSAAVLVDQFMDQLRHAFPELQANIFEVDSDQLKERMAAAQGTSGYPDVLVGTLPPAWWNGLQGEFGLAMLRPANFYQNGVTETAPQAEQLAILRRAPHMQVARAFALWWSEPNADCPGCVQAGISEKDQAAARVATGAMDRLLHGQPLGSDADPAMAGSLSPGLRRMLTTMANTVAEDASFRVDVERASTNGSLAAVALRVVVSSGSVFGVAHPLVVLRATKDGQWRVLQMSLNLPQFEQETVRQALMVTSPTSTAEQRAGVKGVSLAAPQDGATKASPPELVWDNKGGAGLQVVEWQRSADHGWTDARLYLVLDRNPRLQTHVIAQFAAGDGRYRWRVWSVGAHGEMMISPWRGFSVTQ